MLCGDVRCTSRQVRAVKRNTLSCQDFVAYIGVVGIAAKKEKHSGHLSAAKYSYCKNISLQYASQKGLKWTSIAGFKLTTCRSVADSLTLWATLQVNNSMIEKYII